MRAVFSPYSNELLWHQHSPQNATDASFLNNLVSDQIAEDFSRSSIGAIETIVVHGQFGVLEGNNIIEREPSLIEPFIVRFYERAPETGGPDWQNPVSVQLVNGKVFRQGPLIHGGRVVYKVELPLQESVELKQGWVVVQLNATEGQSTGRFLWSRATDGMVNRKAFRRPPSGGPLNLERDFMLELWGSASEASVPYCVDLLQPENGSFISGNQATFQWQISPDALGYILTISDGDQDEQIIIEGANSNSWEVAWLEFGKNYTWSVTPFNSMGEAVDCQQFTFNTADGQNIFIGNGNVNTHFMPIDPHWGYNFSQSIYLQSEINRPDGRIERIHYYYNGAEPGTLFEDWTIYMAHTEKSSFTSVNDWIDISEFEMVFQGKVNITAQEGWVEIILDTPFEYNNTDNLVIAVNETTPGFTSSSARFIGSNVEEVRSIRIRRDHTGPFDPANLPTTGVFILRGIANTWLLINDIPTGPSVTTLQRELAFPNTNLNETSPPQPLTILNNGATMISIQDIQVTENSGDFSIITDLSDLPVNLPVNANLPIELVFTPQNAGLRTGNLIINATSGFEDITFSLPLSGAGIDPTLPVLFVNSAGFDFSITPVNSTTRPVIFVLNNTGGSTLLIQPEDIAITGDADQFVFSGIPGSFSIEAGESAQFSAAFAPVSEGDFSVAVIITNQSGEQTQTTEIVFAGTGLDTEGSLPATEDFTDIPIGELPNDWQTSHPANWGVRNTSLAGGTAPEMRFNWLPQSLGIHPLVTPFYFAPNNSDFFLEFKHYVDYFADSFTLKVQSTTDNGITWNDEWSQLVTEDIPATTVQLSLAHLAGENFRLAWVFDGNTFDINQWTIDDIVIDEKRTLALIPNPEEAGILSGAGDYLPGNTVALEAQPSAGFAFLNWTDPSGNVVSTDAGFSFTMPQNDMSLTGNFVPASTITFSALENGNPLAPVEGVAIMLEGPVSQVLFTGADGTVSSSLPLGNYSYQAFKESWYMAEGLITVGESSAEEIISMVMHPMALFVALTLEEGNQVPLQNVSIDIVGAGSFLTDASGEVSVRLPQGFYSFTASLIGYHPVSGSFQLEDGVISLEEIIFQISPPMATFTEFGPEGAFFGKKLAGNTQTMSINFTNTGTGNLAISLGQNFSIEPSGGAFTILHAEGTPGFWNLQTGESGSVTVAFSPTEAGSASAQLIINHGGNQSVLELSGMGYDPVALPFADDFSNGNFDNWLVVNGNQTNQWHIGTAMNDHGNFSAIVSNDGGTSHQYTTFDATSIVHFYMDFAIPNAPTLLNFDWMGFGEVAYDFLQVFVAESHYSPQAGVAIPHEWAIGSFMGHDTWKNQQIMIPSHFQGSTARLVFTWRNDISLGIQPPAAVDNIILLETINILSADIPPGLGVLLGTPPEDLPLPQSVTVNLSGEYHGTQSIEMEVIWQPELSLYDPWVPGFYEIPGQLIMPLGIKNPQQVNAIFHIVVGQGSPQIIWPEFDGITYGQPLSELIFTGGIATYLGEEVEGIFIPDNPDLILPAGSNQFNLLFYPANIELYGIIMVNLPIEVAPAPLVITANDITKRQGRELIFEGDEFTTDPQILVGEDFISTVTLSSEGASPGAPAGFYPITIEEVTGSGLENYDITLEAGTLEVLEKVQLILSGVVVADKQYDGTPHAEVIQWGSFTGVVEDGLQVHIDVSEAIVEFTDINAGLSVPVTIHNVLLYGEDAVIYELELPTVSANILRKPLTITANSESKVYGNPDPDFSVFIEGFVTNENQFDLSGELIIARETGENVGQYSIIPFGYSSINYEISYIPGTLEITPRETFLAGSFSVADKLFDGTTHADITDNQLVVNNIVARDTLTVSNLTAAFDHAGPGNDIPVKILHAEILGAAAGNYTLSLWDAPVSTANVFSAMYSLTLLPIPTEGGSVSGYGNYGNGFLVTIKATPNQGFAFVNWTDQTTEISTEETFTFQMPDQDVTLVANFTPISNIVEQQEAAKIAMFPNPASKYVHIRSEAIIQTLRIFDLAGKEIYREDINEHTHQLPAFMEPGIYMVRFYTDQGVLTKKLIISK